MKNKLKKALKAALIASFMSTSLGCGIIVVAQGLTLLSNGDNSFYSWGMITMGAFVASFGFAFGREFY